MGGKDETSQIYSILSLAATFLACVRMDRKYFITACIKVEGTANCVTLIATVTFGRFLRENRANAWDGHDVKKFHYREREREREKGETISHRLYECVVYIAIYVYTQFMLSRFELCFRPVCNLCEFYRLVLEEKERQTNIYNEGMSKRHSK